MINVKHVLWNARNKCKSVAAILILFVVLMLTRTPISVILMSGFACKSGFRHLLQLNVCSTVCLTTNMCGCRHPFFYYLFIDWVNEILYSGKEFNLHTLANVRPWKRLSNAQKTAAMSLKNLFAVVTETFTGKYRVLFKIY